MNPTQGPIHPFVEAIYNPSPIAEHAGNGLIEALPLAESDEEALSSVCWQPTFSAAERELPTAARFARLLELRRLMIPLDRHCEVLHTLNAMLTAGYVSRAPNSAERARIAQSLYARRQARQPFSQPAQGAPATTSTALVGLPGMGKTTLVERWADTLPKAIYHPSHHLYQVPVIKADAPSDGSSIKGFCYALLHELDARIPGANYYQEYGIRGRPGADSLLRNVVQLMNTHCLGMLIVDEAQNLANSHKNGQIVLTEVVSAFNEIRAPIVFMGTNKAYQVFEADFRSARRMVNVALPHWDRLRPGSGPGQDEWVDVVMKVWQFQWLRNPVELDEWTVQLLFECSQGVISILVALFAAAQTRAMIDGTEKLSAELIQGVYDTQFRPVHPMIAALRDNNEAALQRYQDIAPPLQGELGRIWTAGTGSTPGKGARGKADTESEAPPSPKKPAARIRSRVARPRSAKRSAPQAKSTPSPETLDAGDYRSAIAGAAERGTTVHDELIRLGLMPTREQFLELLG